MLVCICPLARGLLLCCPLTCWLACPLACWLLLYCPLTCWLACPRACDVCVRVRLLLLVYVGLHARVHVGRLCVGLHVRLHVGCFRVVRTCMSACMSA